MSNIGFENNYNPLIYFNFETVSDRAKTINFMLKYFQNFVINEGRKNGYDFKKCMDIVNSQLLAPVKSILNKGHKLSLGEKARIDLWNLCHQEFETKITIELIKIGNNMDKAELLFKNDL